MKRGLSLLLGFCFVTALQACVPAWTTQREPPRQYVYFIEPADGAALTSPFKLKFGVVGMMLQPSGTVSPDAGHHHLLIDTGAIKKGEVIADDERHRHFCAGETEADVALPAGVHRLTMQFGDGLHRSYGPALAQSISVTVK